MSETTLTRTEFYFNNPNNGQQESCARFLSDIPRVDEIVELYISNDNTVVGVVDAVRHKIVYNTHTIMIYLR